MLSDTLDSQPTNQSELEDTKSKQTFNYLWLMLDGRSKCALTGVKKTTYSRRHTKPVCETDAGSATTKE